MAACESGLNLRRVEKFDRRWLRPQIDQSDFLASRVFVSYRVRSKYLIGLRNCGVRRTLAILKAYETSKTPACWCEDNWRDSEKNHLL